MGLRVGFVSRAHAANSVLGMETLQAFSTNANLVLQNMRVSNPDLLLALSENPWLGFYSDSSGWIFHLDAFWSEERDTSLRFLVCKRLIVTDLPEIMAK